MISRFIFFVLMYSAALTDGRTGRKKDPAIFEDAVMAAGAEQPERLAHYLDIVEVCLLRQISHR